MKIIDAHVHVVQTIAGFGSQGELRACGNGEAIYASGQVIKMIPAELGEYDVTPEKVIKLMDAHNVEKAVLLQGNYFGFQNEYTWQAMKKYPDRFTGAATYDPFCVNKDKILHHLFEELGFKIVKFEVSNGSGLMSYHPPIPLDGPVMDEAYAYANEKNLTFVIDIGRAGNPCWQIDALRRSILRYPNMKFVVCHLLSPLLKDELVMTEGLKQLNLPNVWFDLAALPANQRPETYPYEQARHYLKIGKKIVGADRMMFGSDLPSTLCRDTYEHLVDYALKSDVFTDLEKELVFYQTAKDIYFS
jgi:hypothetical protein